MTDPDTGIGFALPGKADVDSRPGSVDGTTPDVTMYKVDVGGGLSVGVTFGQSSAAEYSAEGLDFVADSLLRQLTAAGASDAAISDRQPSNVGGHPVLDFRLSFTAKNGKKTVWLLRLIGDDTRTVQLQSLVAVDPADVAAVTPMVEKYQRMLVDTVQLP